MTRWRSIGLLACLLLAAPARAQTDDSPAAERATFTVADGFDVALFASEADGVVKPIQLRFDARGRVWVIGSTVYPQIEPGQVPDDKVIVLEDADGDGKSDKTTVFERGLTIPTGIEIDGDAKGAFVGHGTQLIHLRDTDNDGAADERSVLFRGFGTGDSHQNINSFLWGPGGEMWMCQGLSIRSRVETPWGIVSMNQAGVWRVYPRRQKLQSFFGSHFDPQNPWGVAFTDWGEPIVLAGNNSAPIYPVPGLIERHPPMRPPTIWKQGKGRKVGGGDFVATTHFPPDWQGALIVGGYINNAVWVLTAKDDGSGFALEDRAPLITSTSQSFRPVDAKFGPDGALYIADWYNPIIGHYQASLRDPRRDKAHGRIWRVTAKGRALTPRPALVDAPTKELLDNLKLRDRWTRTFSKRVLSSRPTEEVVAAVKAWVAQKPQVSDLALKEAIGVLQSHEAVDAALVERLSKSPVRSARAYAASVIGAWADRLPDPLALLRPLAEDADPRVRLQAIVACTYVQRPEAIEVAMAATDQPRDRFIDYAVTTAVYALKPQWLQPFTEGKLTFGGKTARMTAFVIADGSPDTLGAITKLLSSTTTDPATRENCFRLLITIGDARQLDKVLTMIDTAMLARLVPAFVDAAEVRRVVPTKPSLHGLLDSPDDEAQAAGMRLAGVWKIGAVRGQIGLTALDANKPEAVRIAAIRAWADLGGVSVRDAILKIAGSNDPPAIRAAAIAALAPIDVNVASTQGATLLAGNVPDAVAADLFRALLARDDAAAPLAAALKTTPPPADAARVGLRVMSATGKRDESLAAILGNAAGLNHGPRKIADLAAFAAQVTKDGDAARGAAVFARAETGCAACHAVAGKGGTTGPDLGAVGTAHPIDFIALAILEPNREVREGYIAHAFVTKSGESYQGYLVGENASEVTFRDVATGKDIRLRADAIKTRKQVGSVMPAGLADQMTDGEFRDLVKYLSELGR